MRAAVVMSSEITENNPTLCLSALRYTDGCVRCEIMRRALAVTGQDLKKAEERLRCVPLISTSTREFWKRYHKKQEVRRKIEAELRAMEAEL